LIDIVSILQPQTVVAFFLIFVRVSTILLFAPFFSSQVFYNQIKVFFAILVTFVVLPNVPVNMDYIPENAGFVELLILTFKEMLIGFSMGLIGQTILGGIQLGGQFISIQVGLSFANVVDPTTQLQNPIFSQILTLFAILIFLAIGGDIIYIKALNQSFEAIPLGQVAINGGVETIIDAVGHLFVIGLQMSSPFIVSLLLLDVAFAIFAKMMPQANIFFIAMPLKVGAGIIMLWLVVPRLAVAFTQYFNDMWGTLEKMIAALSGVI
jgi:flagellar biosynthetic protein FliR